MKLPGIIVASVVISQLWSCSAGSQKKNSAELITDTAKQNAIFANLLKVADDALPEGMRKDSLAFLILPVYASCPFCRDRTIDKIAKNKDKINSRHFIIISANVGRKTINAFFRDRNYELPANKQLLLDTTNMTSRFGLCDDKPTMYYAYNGRTYKKVAAIPHTVKKDLNEFFATEP